MRRKHGSQARSKGSQAAKLVTTQTAGKPRRPRDAARTAQQTGPRAWASAGALGPADPRGSGAAGGARGSPRGRIFAHHAAQRGRHSGSRGGWRGAGPSRGRHLPPPGLDHGGPPLCSGECAGDPHDLPWALGSPAVLGRRPSLAGPVGGTGRAEPSTAHLRLPHSAPPWAPVRPSAGEAAGASARATLPSPGAG